MSALVPNLNLDILKQGYYPCLILFYNKKIKLKANYFFVYNRQNAKTNREGMEIMIFAIIYWRLGIIILYPAF